MSLIERLTKLEKHTHIHELQPITILAPQPGQSWQFGKRQFSTKQELTAYLKLIGYVIQTVLVDDIKEVDS